MLCEVLHIKNAYVVFFMNIVLWKFLMCAKACCALKFGEFDCTWKFGKFDCALKFGKFEYFN